MKHSNAARAASLRRVTIQIATSVGIEVIQDAELVTVCNERIAFALHERFPEPRGADSVFDSWTITHIPTGCAFVYGMTRDDAIDKAERTLAKLGANRFKEIVSKWPLIMPGVTADLFEDCP